MRRTIFVAVSVWIVSLLLAVPDLVIAEVNTSLPVPYCDPYHYQWTEDPAKGREWYARFRTVFRFAVLFVGPLVVISCFYTAIAVTLLCRSRDAVEASCAVDSAITRQLNSRRKVLSSTTTSLLVL